MSIIDVTKIRVIIHRGERFGLQKSSYTLMKHLRELGFKGQFEILYEDLYPEPADTKYTSYVANSIPGSQMKHMPQPLEMQHKRYFNKLASLMKQLLPRYTVEYDRLDQILKNTCIDEATKINHINDILIQYLNSMQEDLRLIQDAYEQAYINLVNTFKSEIIKEKDMVLPPTEVRLSCNSPTREVVESSAEPKEKQLLDFIHTHTDSVSIQLVYGLKPLVIATNRQEARRNNVGYNARKLEIIFSGYISPDIANESTRSESVAINHHVLGDLIITRLPASRSEWHLDQIPLSFLAATDNDTPGYRPASIYSTDVCVVTQPTNWRSKCFIDIADQVTPILLEEQLCSFSYNGKQYCIDINDSSAILAMSESAEFHNNSKLLEALRAFRTAQLKQNEQAYKYRDISLFNSMRLDAPGDKKPSQPEPDNINTRYIDPLDQLQDLIAFYNTNKSSMKRPYVLLVPNFEKVFPHMPNESIIDKLGNNVTIIKNTTEINLNDDCIYILRTGSLHSEVFDYLMALPNMLPPVIEGCNAMELCEYNGVPFLLASRGRHVVQKLFTENENFNRIQNLHINASLYLSNGKEEHKQAYINYMHLAINKPKEIATYSQQRKDIYKNTRSDVIDRSIQVITATGLKTQSSVYEFRKAPAPTIN